MTTKDQNPWVMFTKRTNDPTLSWLESQLDKLGIEHRRNGESCYAPIMEVREASLSDAWAVLDPVDELEDDLERFWNPNNKE